MSVDLRLPSLSEGLDRKKTSVLVWTGPIESITRFPSVPSDMYELLYIKQYTHILNYK